ncbi:MAG: hypothetical protein ABIZ81_03945 [Opitutaceae bacterium]
MKRLLIGLLAMAAIFAPLAFAATAAKPAAAPSSQSPAAPIAGVISTVTGIAISPLLGTAVFGAWQYFRAHDDAAKAALPWFAKVKFWLPALLIVAVCAAKDAFGAVVPPGWKKPLDVLETIENKASGLVAVGAVVPFTLGAISKWVFGSGSALVDPIALPSGLAMIPIGAFDLSWLLNLLTAPFAMAMFAVVWMASHSINVLILLSPWGAIDAGLKAARTALLGVLTVTSQINPWAGAGLSLIVVLVAWAVSGWSFRLTFFGTVFCWDWFTRRRTRFVPKENDNWMFAGGSLPGVPPRTYGRLVRSENALVFNYRPWLLGRPQVAILPAGAAQLGVGRGLFFSGVAVPEQPTLLLLPPRYHGHEEAVARAYAMGAGVHEAGIRKAWGLLRELFGGAAAQTQVG